MFEIFLNISRQQQQKTVANKMMYLPFESLSSDRL